jgi:uncharacterized linocin/CFP29 family protein
MELEFISNGQPFGDAATRLLNSGMNPAVLRTNATLRREDWLEVDRVVLAEARRRLNGIGDLLSRGLRRNIRNAMGVLVIESETLNDFGDAQLDMDGLTQGTKENANYEPLYMPLPILHKPFNIGLRQLSASRNRGEGLDTTKSRLATQSVVETAEKILFQGASAFKYGGGTIRGYLDYPTRNTVSFSVGHWNDSPTTAADVIVDVLAMKQELLDARMFGPYVLYVPTVYETVLDKDYNVTGSARVTIRQRLLEIGGIADVKVSDFLTADNVLLVQMSEDCIRMLVGFEPMTIQWETKGGMNTEFEVMSIMVPEIRSTQAGRCGIAHLS